MLPLEPLGIESARKITLTKNSNEITQGTVLQGQIPTSSGNVISTLGNYFCDSKQSFERYQ